MYQAVVDAASSGQVRPPNKAAVMGAEEEPPKAEAEPMEKDDKKKEASRSRSRSRGRSGVRFSP